MESATKAKISEKERELEKKVDEKLKRIYKSVEFFESKGIKAE